MPERRLTLANIQLRGRTWEEVAFELQRFLEALNDTQDDDVAPPGASILVPQDVTDAAVGEVGDPTTGWANGGHIHAAPDFLLLDGSRPMDGDLNLGGNDLVNVGAIFVAVRTEVADYPVADGDNVILVDATAGLVTITLPLASPNEGRILRVKKIDSVQTNAVKIDGNGAETIDGAADLDLLLQDETATVVSDGTEWWVI